MFHDLWQLFLHAVDIFLHLDGHLDAWSASIGPWLYLVLFLTVFCETGLVVTPFLPGDSLLFAAGALAARELAPIEVAYVIPLLIVAGILGDASNYAIGKRIGPRIFTSQRSWLLNQEHLLRTQRFYEKHGGITIVIARFMPIVRTLAPFVAGVGRMQYRRFAMYNVVGAIVWVVSFTLLGWAFGNIPAVKTNFQYVVLGIVALSVTPMAWEFFKHQRNKIKPA